MLFFCFIFCKVEDCVKRELNSGVKLQKVSRIPK
jgi:hypothetical protein